MNTIRLLCCTLIVGMTTGLSAQRCGYTDTIPLADFGDTTITVSIDGYLNNDLGAAGQGLCGVQLFFRHSYVYDFTATVTSPSGQSVQLIGPVNNQSRPPTSLARWFVEFTRCVDAATPDFPAPAQWDNDGPFNWPAFGTYDGVYYPSDGCLEDFNTGPVNGDWTFTFSTARAAQQGQGVFLLLEFCDDAHVDGPCCFADAGTLQPIPGLEFCEESPALPLPLAPVYNRPRPSTGQYGYTFLLARDGVLVDNQNSPNLANLPAGSYEICGLSYRLGELGQLDFNAITNYDDLRADLEGVNPTLCADLTPVCQTVILRPIPDTNYINRTICQGGTVFVGGTNYFTTGVRTINLVGRAGCDSVIVLDLNVVTELREDVAVEACADRPYVQGNNSYTVAGIYRDTFMSDLGCDSIVTLDLSFAPPITSVVSTAICAGDSYTIGGEAFTTDTLVTRTIPSFAGCDSTVTLRLRLLDPGIVFEPIGNGFTCESDTLILDASNSRFGIRDSVRARGVWTDSLGNDLSFERQFPITEGGWYYYELSNTFRSIGCTVLDSIFVPDFRLDVAADLAWAQVPCGGPDEQPCGVISCRNPTIGFSVTPTSAARAYTYTWTAGPGGNILGDPTAAAIDVDAPGTYFVRVEDPLSRCGLDTFVVVGIDTLSPSTAITGLELLTCAVTELNLLADTNQVNHPRLDYRWTGPCLPAPVDGPALSTSCPGTYELTVTDRVNACVSVRTFTIDQDISTVAVQLVDTTAQLSCLAPEQLLDASGSNSTNDVEYAWIRAGSPDTLATTASFLVDVAGTYYLRAVDSISRCRTLDSVYVPADTLLPVADSGPDTLLLNCYTPDHVLGNRTTSTGNNFRYQWVELNNPADTISRLRDLFVSEPGIYSLRVEDVTNGCTDVDVTRVVFARDTPFVRLQPVLDFTCFVDSVALDARATNLNYDNVQQWSGPCLSSEPDTNLAYAFCPGEYVYRVINQESGCQAADTLNVLLGPNSVVAVLPDSAFLDCETGETRLDRSQGTNAPIVEWYRDGVPLELVGQRPRVRIPGTYTLVLANFNQSCRDTATIVVTAPCPALSIIIPPDSLTCDRQVITLDATTSVPSPAGDVTTEWLVPPGVTTQPGTSARALTIFEPGRYGFVISNLISGDVDTSYVDVIQNIEIPVATAGDRDTINCYGPTTLLDGTGSSTGPLFDYLWTNTADDTIAMTLTTTVGDGGIYLLRVTQRETGCSAVSNVRILADFGVPDINFSSPRIPCDTVDFALTAFPDQPGSYAYNWTGPNIITDADSAAVRISDTGTYTVVLTDIENGCTVAKAVDTERLPCPPFPQLRDTSLSCNFDTIVLAATFRDPCQDCTYTWERNGTNILGETDTTLAVTTAGTYRIVAINRFGLIGTAESNVVDNRVVPTANAGPDQRLTCAVASVTLGGDNPIQGFNFGYQWYGPDGAPISGATSDSLVVNDDGLYQLESINLLSDCQIRDTVLVVYDTISPVADAGQGRLLDCNNKVRVLDAAASSLGNQFRYQWSGGPSPACLEGATTLNPQVRCGGDYQVLVTNRDNGCSSTATVFVETADELPVVIPLPDTTLNCTADTLRLRGEDISRPDIRFGWERVFASGNIPIETTVPGTLELTDGGTYYFSITDTLTGCFNDFTVEVRADLSVPNLTVSAPDTFFCALDSLRVSGSAMLDNGRVPEYEWQSRIGFFVENADAPVATIFQPDVYYLTVRDPLNFCESTDSVVIFRDTQSPLVEAGNDTALTCTLRQLQLSGSAVTISGQTDFAWSTRDGNLVSGDLGPTPLINAAGAYQLTVIDPLNECEGADIVRVVEDTIRPLSRVTYPQGEVLNCFRDRIPLRGGAISATGTTNFGYRWSLPPAAANGTTPTTRDIVVSVAGSYRLIVQDANNGCRDTTLGVVTEDFLPPTAVIPPPDPLTCVRDSVILALATEPPPAYRFQWFDQQDSLLGRGASQVVTEEAVYTLIVQDLRNGCLDTTTTSIGSDLTPPVVRLTEPEVLNCFRAATFIDGNGSSVGDRFIIDWSSPQGNAQIDEEDPYLIAAGLPGTYVLTVTNEVNGCVTSDSVEVFQDAVAIDSFSFEVDQPACDRDRDGGVVITDIQGGTAPFSFQVDGGVITDRREYDNLPVGVFELEVFGADGCSIAETFEIIQPEPPMLDLREDTTIVLGDSVRLDFTTNFPNWDTLIWSSSGPLPPLQSDSALVVSPLGSQSYRLQILDDEGCSATDFMVITVDGQVNVYVPSAFSPNGDGNNDLMRPYAGPQVERITGFQIFNRWGELLYDLAADPGRDTDTFGWDGRLNGRLLNPQTLVYRMEVLLIDDTEFEQKGSFVLMR